MIDRRLMEEAGNPVIGCDEDEAIGIARKAISEGLDVVELMKEGFIAGI